MSCSAAVAVCMVLSARTNTRREGRLTVQRVSLTCTNALLTPLNAKPNGVILQLLMWWHSTLPARGSVSRHVCRGMSPSGFRFQCRGLRLTCFARFGSLSEDALMAPKIGLHFQILNYI
jgi:hypothetical protein